ncbi:hypothetical protein E2C01_029434 [Portunus trituberculatus]|uniref:Uncharacterized protein n=1 Tax=Portunus trituberculatus TaxID=210409 RepID=A0A5B7EPC6_PORTR|nr:hypothetical protein [Portunus trituberculatus]
MLLLKDTPLTSFKLESRSGKPPKVAQPDGESNQRQERFFAVFVDTSILTAQPASQPPLHGCEFHSFLAAL